MRLICPICKDYRTHYRDSKSGEWVCDVCKNQQPEPDVVKVSQDDKDHTI